ncbi:MAG: transporter, partial [Terracidiphilus sp.]
MQIPRTVRNRLLAAAAFALILLPSGVRAHAVSKEIVELQTQVQQLLDMVQRLQSTMDSRFGVLQNLSQQTADEANQMTAAVTALQQKLNTQNDAVNGKLDSTSGQIQSLNDSVDELKSRITKLDKTVQDLQAQLQAMQAPPPSAQPAGGPAGPTASGAMPPQGGDASQSIPG